MTLGELKNLCAHLSLTWADHVEVAVSHSHLTTGETIVGHYESASDGPVILIVGKRS